jgi:antitoxin VapB
MASKQRAAAQTTQHRAKLFTHGRSQAVRLPKEFQFVGLSEVLVSRTEQGVLLAPAISPKKLGSWDELFDFLDATDTPDFMLNRNQPLPQRRVCPGDNDTTLVTVRSAPKKPVSKEQ